MSNPRLILVAFAAAVVLAACGSEPEPPPAPVGPTAEELERMRQDSIARARAAEEAAARAEAERAERERQRQIEAAKRTLTEMVFFDYDEAALSSEAERVLRAKLDILRANPSVQLRMDGHADERGTSEYNIALGNDRAEAVIQFLTGFGLSADRFAANSFGEERPLASGSSESSWARNRRVEFVITAGENSINP